MMEAYTVGFLCTPCPSRSVFWVAKEVDPRLALYKCYI